MLTARGSASSIAPLTRRGTKPALLLFLLLFPATLDLDHNRVGRGRNHQLLAQRTPRTSGSPSRQQTAPDPPELYAWPPVVAFFIGVGSSPRAIGRRLPYPPPSIC